MTDIEDFNLDEELALLEAQGASAQKYFMHSNAHQMAFTKYVTSAKQAKESGNAVLAKKLNSMGKKHKAAAEALGALAGHHIDHEFSRQLRIKQAAQANPPMKEEIEVTDDLDFDITDLEIDGPESLEEAFQKGYKSGDGYEGRRTKAQEIAGRHISKVLGSTKVDVVHHEKGGLNILSKSHGQPGNNKHVREMSKTLDAHGIPHRYEERSGAWGGKHKDYLYMLSADAHDHGARIHAAKQQDKLHQKLADHEKDRLRLVQNNEEYEPMNEETEVVETNPIQELIALAINKKPVDFADRVQDIIRSIAGEKLAQVQEDLARSIGGTEIEEDDEDTLEEISVPPTGKPVESMPGASESDPSTKTAPTLTATGSKKHLVKSNAKTPEQKSVSKAAGDTFRSQEAAK